MIISHCSFRLSKVKEQEGRRKRKERERERERERENTVNVFEMWNVLTSTHSCSPVLVEWLLRVIWC